MRGAVLTLILLSILGIGCTDKPKQQTLIGGADGPTSIIVANKDDKPDKDTVIYELPECELWYAKKLPEKYRGKDICIWTEHKSYWEDVQVINVFVANPTDTPLSFGRRTDFLQQKSGKWCLPEQKDTTCVIVWPDDEFIVKEAPLLYCFRCKLDEYHIPKGVYCVRKSFWQGEKKIDLTTEFEVK